MSTLHDRVRGALASADPTEGRAKEDLDAVLRRAQKGRGPSRARALVVVPALAGAALAAYVAHAARVHSPAPTASPADRGVHLYLRETSEPEDRAFAIDLIAQGDH
jgi:hypothetical protein